MEVKSSIYWYLLVYVRGLCVDSVLCLIGLHDWERVGVVKPIRTEGEWNTGLYEGHKAMGRCRKCGKTELRNVGGRHRWYNIDEITEEEYIRRFKEGEYNLEGE